VSGRFGIAALTEEALDMTSVRRTASAIGEENMPNNGNLRVRFANAAVVQRQAFEVNTKTEADF
jgi:hypothetical protein